MAAIEKSPYVSNGLTAIAMKFGIMTHLDARKRVDH